jgi:hypothetical protein
MIQLLAAEAVHLPLQIKKTEKVNAVAFRNAAKVQELEMPATTKSNLLVAFSTHR